LQYPSVVILIAKTTLLIRSPCVTLNEKIKHRLIEFPEPNTAARHDA
jgi:hypothetical protein